ncbi:MAG: interleukin-like EMT inducer domain-containing protein, partial [Chloroflexota bacterium]
AKFNRYSNTASSSESLHWAAILSGVVYGFGSSRLFYLALGQFNIASVHWIPFAILFFLKMVSAPKDNRWAALTALFLVLQAWAELTYASFLIVFMAFAWLFWFIADKHRQVIRWPFIRATGLLIILFVIGIGPFLAAILPDMRSEGDFFVVDGGFADSFSGDVFGFFVPTMHHPFLGDLVTTSGVRGYNLGQQIYIGYGALILSGVALFYHRRQATVWFWAFTVLMFAFLIAGPQVLIKGWASGIPGPFVILQKLPIFNGNRYPSRFSVMLLLSLAPLVGLGFATLSQRLSAKHHRASFLLFLPICLIIVFENLSLPLPQSAMRVPKPYDIIAADQDQLTVLDIPFAWRNGFRVSGAQTTSFMFGQFYQTYHQKPLLQGNTSRNPILKFQYFAEAPVINTLTLLETDYPLPPETWQKDQAYAADVLRFFNIKYIVVRPELPGYLNHPQATIPYIEQVLPVKPIHQDDALLLYEVQLPSHPTQVELLTESPLSNLYFAEGWGVRQPQSIVAHRQRVRLLVPLNGQAQRIQLTMSPDSPSNEMWLTSNGWQSDVLKLSGKQQTVSIDMPELAVRQGTNEIFLHFQRAQAISDGMSDITVISAGEEGGNVGQIYVNGGSVSPGRRGYNIAVLSPNHEVLSVAAFDTFAAASESEEMVQFLASVSPESIIAVAAKDEASTQLSEQAVRALQSFGSQVDLRGQIRSSHAFIGNKQGTIYWEASDPLQRPVKLSTGAGLIEPTIAAIFTEIKFEAK